MTGVEAAIAVVVIACGAAVQSAIGFGVAIVAAPILVLVEPDLVPGPIIMANLLLSSIVGFEHRAHADRPFVAWATLGRVPGTAIGALMVAGLSTRSLSVVFSLMLLTAVGLSAAGLHVEPNRRAIVGLGVVAAIMGTTTSIGGPPMALALQRRGGPEVRGTMTWLAVAGTSLSIGGLVLVGELGFKELTYAAILAPGVLVGIAVARPVRPWLDRGWTRPVILAFAAFVAVIVLVRALA
ncbi:MAG: sulfite exporter TauE/SafE family protein [Actinomycetota bacterium]|nr:sulfite exporter TauE/SafE family protein [Actinomycetota bacterium]